MSKEKKSTREITEMTIFGRSQYDYIKGKWCSGCDGDDYGFESFDQFCEHITQFYGPSANLERDPNSSQERGQVKVTYSQWSFALHIMPKFAEWHPPTCAPARPEILEISRSCAIAIMSCGHCDMDWGNTHGKWEAPLSTPDALSIIVELSKTLLLTHLYIASGPEEPALVLFGMSGWSNIPALERLSTEERDTTYLVRLGEKSISRFEGLEYDFDDGFGKDTMSIIYQHMPFLVDMVRFRQSKPSVAGPLLTLKQFE